MLAIECATSLPSVTLQAKLYSNCGRLAVEITTLGGDRATVMTSTRPPAGSFAYLVRNRIKVPAIVAWAAGDMLGLSFEESMDGDWREEAFKA
jgi:hypothetical protein